jgi:hypothetical protein
MLWQKQRNILAFPYGWQHPAKTEEWAYQRCLLDLPESHFIEIICFPWATLIDLLRKDQQSKAQVYLDALQSASPRKTLIRATICQHIYMKDLLPFFSQLKITDIFWSHAIKGETQLQGVRIHAFPLYPVRCAELDNKPLKPFHERRYLYSFVGAYDPKLYLTPIRQWLSDLPFSSDSVIQLRDEWHYQQPVYTEQIEGVAMGIEQLQKHQQLSLEYEEVMRETVFCLCPSGSGPNSIRLWEALGFGCVPVLLSDTLRLPGDQHFWHSAVLQIPEKKSVVSELPELLKRLSPTDFISGGELLWQRYGLSGFNFDVNQLSPAVSCLR